MKKIEFDDRISMALCVGNGRDFNDRWDIRKDIRVCDQGYAIRYAPKDYILVQWAGVSDDESTLYYLPGDGAIEVVDPAMKSYGEAVETAMLAHGNPERLAYLRQKRDAEAAAKAARKRYGRSHQRARLDSYEATIPVGSFFRTPSGYIGYMAGRGEERVTWYAVDAVPDGAEVLELPREVTAHFTM
ncbi:hypothetical protein [Bosea robiniae]|uniref:Uncharacterized protein n=1 Tax=Bosea robiniae TaxID=1036780 RepID=A0ABY0P417_9HYPH|nr:hypothetical protein [Bosea robiniae]SDH20326.1 hypothetical protein SAMN05421844_107149 [Bosea robiniae]